MNGILHFLDTGHSDCIIIESCGRFAMIDAAEDTDYPADKPHLNLKGYEKEVCDYLLKNCADESGRVTLDFIVATHSHSDHIGGFDTIIHHPDITVKKAFLKPYKSSDIFIMERKRWDNQEVYNQMKTALAEKHVPVSESFDNYSFDFGKFKITLLNGKYRKPEIKFGENINSVVTLIESKGTKALLTGDLNYKNGGEARIAARTGRVNLLKVGHHGYFGSTSFKFVRTLNPDIAVVTNTYKAVSPDVKYKLTKSRAEIYATADCGGAKAYIYDNGRIEMKTGIM